MPQNKLSAALQNTSDYKLENAKTDAAISEAETEYAMNGELHNAISAFAFLRGNISAIHTIYSIFHLTKSIYCAIMDLLLNFVQFQNEKHTLFKFVRSQKV